MLYIYWLLPSMLEGLLITLKVFLITLMISIPLGIVVSMCRVSNIKVINRIVQFYIWIMRGTPLLLQLIFVFFGLPIIHITFDRFTAAIIAFALNYSAYFGEIFRGGIKAIDEGQFEAAKVLGLSPIRTFIRIVFPQMTKIVLPPVANEVITLVKDTSLVYVVGLSEILQAGKIAANRDASLIPLALVGVFYLFLTAILTKVFKSLERRYEYFK